jgi:hypothetical protein
MELITGFPGNSVLSLKTFQPVEMQFPPFIAASTVTITWLPKTPALVHQTNTPHVPAGYRKVTAPAGAH